MSSITQPDPTVIDEFAASQPPPALVDHVYNFPPSLAQYNIPLDQVIAQNAPRNTIGVGAFVFRQLQSAQNTDTDSGDISGGNHPRQLLLIRRSASEKAYPCMYEVPGGGAEAPPIDSTLLDSVARELFEETGLTAKTILRLIDTADFEGRRGDKWRKFNFEVEVHDSECVVLQPAEHDDYKWVDYQEFVAQEGLGDDGWLGRTMPAQMATIHRAFTDA